MRRVLGRQLGRERLTPGLERLDRFADRQRGGERRVLRRVLTCDREHAGVHLLPDARHREQQLRSGLGQVLGDQLGIGAGGDLIAERHPLVVGVHPLRDVRHREVRDEPETGRVDRFETTPEALDGPHDVGVVEHHPLRRPGRARRVDDRREVVGTGGAHGRVEIDRVVADQLLEGQQVTGGFARLRVDDREVPKERQLVADGGDPLPVSAVNDARHRLAVPGDEGHLFGGGGVVDRHRRRPEQQRGQIDDVELGSVAHHEHDPVAPSDAELAHRPRDPTGPVGVLGPRPSPPPVAGLPAQRDLVRAGGDRVPKPGRDGVTGHRRGELLGRDVRHVAPLSAQSRAAPARRCGAPIQPAAASRSWGAFSTGLGGERLPAGGKPVEIGGYCSDRVPRRPLGRPAAGPGSLRRTLLGARRVWNWARR